MTKKRPDTEVTDELSPEERERVQQAAKERHRPPEPLPGTEAAAEKGCLCARMDNHHGRGRYGDGDRYGWFITEGCPVHDAREK